MATRLRTISARFSSVSARLPPVCDCRPSVTARKAYSVSPVRSCSRNSAAIHRPADRHVADDRGRIPRGRGGHVARDAAQRLGHRQAGADRPDHQARAHPASAGTAHRNSGRAASRRSRGQPAAPASGAASSASGGPAEPLSPPATPPGPRPADQRHHRPSDDLLLRDVGIEAQEARKPRSEARRSPMPAMRMLGSAVHRDLRRIATAPRDTRPARPARARACDQRQACRAADRASARPPAAGSGRSAPQASRSAFIQASPRPKYSSLSWKPGRMPGRHPAAADPAGRDPRRWYSKVKMSFIVMISPSRPKTSETWRDPAAAVAHALDLDDEVHGAGDLGADGARAAGLLCPSAPCSRCGSARRAWCWRGRCRSSRHGRCSSPAACRRPRRRAPRRR